MNANKALWAKGDFTRLAATMRESGGDPIMGRPRVDLEEKHEPPCSTSADAELCLERTGMPSRKPLDLSREREAAPRCI